MTALFAYLVCARAAGPCQPPPNHIAFSPVPIYMECKTDHIPIHISAATTVHIIRLSPSTLRGNPNISSAGVFEDISSRQSSLDWPSQTEGRWMTNPETHVAMAETQMVPNHFILKCAMTNFGSATYEDTVAHLIVDTSD